MRENPKRVDILIVLLAAILVAFATFIVLSVVLVSP